jgi:hypothetical protein
VLVKLRCPVEDKLGREDCLAGSEIADQQDEIPFVKTSLQ